MLKILASRDYSAIGDICPTSFPDIVVSDSIGSDRYEPLSIADHRSIDIHNPKNATVIGGYLSVGNLQHSVGTRVVEFLAGRGFETYKDLASNISGVQKLVSEEKFDIIKFVLKNTDYLK